MVHTLPFWFLHLWFLFWLQFCGYAVPYLHAVCLVAAPLPRGYVHAHVHTWLRFTALPHPHTRLPTAARFLHTRVLPLPYTALPFTYTTLPPHRTCRSATFWLPHYRTSYLDSGCLVTWFTAHACGFAVLAHLPCRFTYGSDPTALRLPYAVGCRLPAVNTYRYAATPLPGCVPAVGLPRFRVLPVYLYTPAVAYTATCLHLRLPLPCVCTLLRLRLHVTTRCRSGSHHTLVFVTHVCILRGYGWVAHTAYPLHYTCGCLRFSAFGCAIHPLLDAFGCHGYGCHGCLCLVRFSSTVIWFG